MELQAKTEVKERAPQFRQHNKPSHGQFNLVLGDLMEAAQLQVGMSDKTHEPIEGASESTEHKEKPEETEEVDSQEHETDTDDVETVYAEAPQQLVEITQAAELAVAATSPATLNTEATEESEILGQATAPEILQDEVNEESPRFIEAESAAIDTYVEQEADSNFASSEPSIVASEGPVAIDIAPAPVDSSKSVPEKPVRQDESIAVVNQQARETNVAENAEAVTEETQTNTPQAVSAQKAISEITENMEPSTDSSSAMAVAKPSTPVPVSTTESASVARRLEDNSPEKTVVKGTEDVQVSSVAPPLSAQEAQLGPMVPIAALAAATATVAGSTANQPPQLSVQGSQAIAKAQASEQSAPIKEVSATEKSDIETRRAKAAPKLTSARNVNSRQIEIIRQVAKSIALRGASRNTDVRLALSPPNLGTVRLKISMNDGVLSGSIITESQSIRHMLQQQIPELREALTQDGIQLGDLDVSTEEQQQPSSRQGQESASQQPSRAMAQTIGNEPQIETKPEVATVNDGRVQGYM